MQVLQLLCFSYYFLFCCFHILLLLLHFLLLLRSSVAIASYLLELFHCIPDQHIAPHKTRFYMTRFWLLCERCSYQRWQQRLRLHRSLRRSLCSCICFSLRAGLGGLVAYSTKGRRVVIAPDMWHSLYASELTVLNNVGGTGYAEHTVGGGCSTNYDWVATAGGSGFVLLLQAVPTVLHLICSFLFLHPNTYLNCSRLFSYLSGGACNGCQSTVSGVSRYKTWQPE